MDKATELELKRRWCEVTLERKELISRSWKQVTEAVQKHLDAGIEALGQTLAGIAQEYEEAGGSVFTVLFLGEMGKRGPNHDQVDEAVGERFPKDQVLPASESDGFYAYCTEAIADEVERFLRAKYRSLEFERQTLRPGELWLPGLNGVKRVRAWMERQGFRMRRSEWTRRKRSPRAVQQAKRKVRGGPTTKRASSKAQ